MTDPIAAEPAPASPALSAETPVTMPAAVYHNPGDVRVEEVAVPAPGPEDVLIEVGYCGICGTDLHTMLDGWGVPRSVAGHEYSGRVVATGLDAREIEVGAAVTAVPARTCGTCEGCIAGRPSLCRAINLLDPSWQGGFARYVRAHKSQVRLVPDELDLRTASLAEPLAVALHAIARGGPEARARCLVTGAGPLGLLVVAALRVGGAGDIVVTEPHASRRAVAMAVGATEAVAPEALIPPLIPTRVADQPFDLALECSGKATAMEEALAQLRPGGTLVLVGTGLTPPRLDPNRIILHELVVTGAFNYDADGFEAALALLASRRLPIDELVEPDDVPLEELSWAMQRLAAGELARKVLVRIAGG